MPKQKITKEMVVEAAFSLTREKGLENVTVKDIAGALSCSVQPIYSYCDSMEGLRERPGTGQPLHRGISVRPHRSRGLFPQYRLRLHQPCPGRAPFVPAFHHPQAGRGRLL